MAKTNRKRLGVIGILFVLLLTGALIFIYNYLTPIVYDDYSYTFSFFDGQKISSLSDIVKSMNAHYYSMNGRYVTHFLAQTFLLLGENLFNIINTLAFLLLGALACFHALGDFSKIRARHLAFAYASMFLFAPAFAESFLWTVGSSNYLYGILIVFVCLIPFRTYFANGKIKSYGAFKNIILALFMLIFCAVGGATNENNSISFIAIIVLYIIYFLAKERRVPVWMLTSLLGAIGGCLTLLLSPGENKRLDEEGGIQIISLFNRTAHYTLTLLDYFAVFLFIVALLIVAVGIKQSDIKKNGLKNIAKSLSEKYFTAIVYFIGMLGGVYSMIVAPYFPNRVWSGPLMLMIITVLALYNKIESEKAHGIKKFAVAAVIILSLSAVGTYGNNIFNLYYSNNQFNQRSEYIQQQVEDGQTVVEVPAITSDGKYTLFGDGDLIYDSNEWPNVSVAKYYGAEKIVRNDDVPLD